MSNNRLLYEQVYDSLKEEILSGIYSEGSLLPSERIIGEIHKVDRTTVRKALKLLVDENLVVKLAGIGTKVTRQDQTDEEPDTKSQGMGTQGTIGFFLPPSMHRRDRISQPFYSSLFYYIEKFCRENGWVCYYSSLDEQDNFSEMLANQRYSGIIFVSNSPEQFIKIALEAKIPSVLVNEYNKNLLSFLPDNTNGMIQMCEYLVALGHRQFALITGIPSYTTTRERMIGCSYALSQHNIPQPYIASCDWEPDTAYAVAKDLLLSSDPLPTAIIGFNDNIAIGCLRAAGELGLRVPEDISIVGFDDVEQSRYTIPSITTVHIGIRELAQATVQGLFSLMHSPDAFTAMRSYVPAKITVRKSTAPPPERECHYLATKELSND